jgi:hypothetical protein
MLNSPVFSFSFVQRRATIRNAFGVYGLYTLPLRESYLINKAATNSRQYYFEDTVYESFDAILIHDLKKKKLFHPKKNSDLESLHCRERNPHFEVQW